MKPFRGITDPLCLLACGLYLANRFWFRSHVGGAFLQGYFDDILLVPAALPLVLSIHAMLRWRNPADAPDAREILLHVAIWSGVCEWLGPHLSPGAVGDPLDVLCYAAGGLAAWAWWNRNLFSPSGFRA